MKNITKIFIEELLLKNLTYFETKFEMMSC
jgi:hypothetical protein